MIIANSDDRMKVLDIMDSVISDARSTPKENGPVTGKVIHFHNLCR